MPGISIGVQVAYEVALTEALYGQHEFVEPEHFFIGICKVGGMAEDFDWERSQMPAALEKSFRSEIDAIAELFERFGLDRIDLYRETRKRKGQGNHRHTSSAIHRSEQSRAAFRRAEEMADKAQAILVDVTHLLTAFLEDADGPIAAFLREKGVEPIALRQATLNATIIPFDPKADSPVLGGAGPERAEPLVAAAGHDDLSLGGRRAAGSPQAGRGGAAGSSLAAFGKDLTRLAREGKIHAPVGRKKEMLEVVRVLSQSTKNCPVLVGEAGVGKTAVVEGLACRIASGRAPVAVQGTRIIQIDMAALVAGTKYRGDFEERLTKVLRDGASPDVILFIDEIHTVLGAGGAGGPLDAANILKPALGRGEVRLIGATTLQEFRRHIEKDAALERRLEPVIVDEPTPDETLTILQGVRGRLQEHHRVVIRDEALAAAVDLSVRHLRDRRLPDKAIDLLEKACAAVAVVWTSAIPGEEPPDQPGTIGTNDVAKVVAQRTGIPVARLSEDDRDRLRRMADELKQRVIGQDEACEAVAKAVQRARVGLKADDRPVGVLLFAGPTGVGKTELARATAEFLFGASNKMVRLDMSEFMEKHAVARLIGSPPGYVGHDEEGQLTGALRRTPHCVVLLDEIEKSHPDVLSLFLQVFDAGRLTDAKGRTADCTNALFILTTNLPLDVGSVSSVARGDGPSRQALLRHNLRPELVDRIDQVVLFRPLGLEDLKAIAARQFSELAGQLQKQGITLTWDTAVLGHLAFASPLELCGARELLRVIDRQVKDEIAGKMARQEIGPAGVVALGVQDGLITIEFSSWSKR